MRVGEGKIQKKRVCGPTNDTPVAQNKNVATFCLSDYLATDCTALTYQAPREEGEDEEEHQIGGVRLLADFHTCVVANTIAIWYVLHVSQIKRKRTCTKPLLIFNIRCEDN